VTNAPRPAGELCIEEIKKQFEAGDIIEDLVIGAECARAKPFGDPYIEGMKRLGKKPEECIVFEDSRSGISAGKAAGVSAIVGIRSSLDDAQLRAHGATATMKDWQELTPEMLIGLLNDSTVSDNDSLSGQVQPVVLHLCGSNASDYYEGVSIIYGSECFKAVMPQGTYKNSLCFVHQDGKWSFPQDTSEEARTAAVRMSFPEAMVKIAELEPNAIVPHMFCLPGLTDFRALFETMGIPVVGNTADVMSLSEDKWKTKAVVAASGVKVPHAEILHTGDKPTLSPPFLLKPCSEANSQGVSLVRPGDDVQQALDLAFSFGDEVLCEEFVPLGRELRVAGLEMPDGSLKVLPCVEYFLNEKEPIRTAQQKLQTDSRGVPTTFAPVNRKCPADIDDVLAAKLQDMVERSHKALGCRDYSLYDVRVDPQGEPYFIEACLYCSFAPKSVIVLMGAGMQSPLEQQTIFEMLVDRAIERKNKADELKSQGKVLGMKGKH
jgi:D-alanine-D-alanine ligase